MLKVGDIVKVKNLYGPNMVVDWLHNTANQGQVYVECFWFDKEHRRNWHKFNPLTLEKVLRDGHGNVVPNKVIK